ncbi:PREDICTED: uncharacterized protein LOC104803289 [Tarenaya hassleriana]|nr:PREDICTED: uncharacterized protein LOC104803289 [Tarenaya hassleriana]
MAGLHSSSSSSRLLPSSSSSFSRLVFLLTLLPLTLACFAFILQWRGGLNDPITRWSPDRHEFPGMGSVSEKSSLRSSSSDSGCANILGQSRSPSFPYFRDSKFDYGSDLKPRICITTSTSAGLEQTLPWIFFHKTIGVSTFYLFVEGKAASSNVSRVLETISGVKVIYRSKELEEQQAKSRIWNETWLASFFYKPCNYELFVKQTLNMEMAITMARDAGMDWIIHLDTDELIHPSGTQEYSLRQLLGNVPANVDQVIFPNYESSVERDDIKEPFSEVSMFKKNYDHLPNDVYFGSYKESTRGNPNYFLTYGNGKSAARIQDHLRPNGAHRWHNYMKSPDEIKLDEAAVLHYTYPKFSDLISRRDRCGCKPTKEDVKRCFMLEFDRAAFIIASTASEEELLQWYRERVVWTDRKLTLKLLRKGILTRIYAPMVIIRELREAGVFSSVIASAHMSLPRDHSNSSNVEKTREFSQATARKVLEFDLDGGLEASAVPPQSPPGSEETEGVIYPSSLSAQSSMNRVLQLGFQDSIINVARFVVLPCRRIRTGSFVSVRIGATTLKKTVVSNAPKLMSSITNDNKGKKLKVEAAINQNSHEMVDAKGIEGDDHSEDMGSVLGDHRDIEAMTVQELRATLRRLGLPPKGRKQNLVSALRSCMDRNVSDEISGAAAEETTLLTRSKSTSIKRKVKSREETTDGASVISHEQGKRRVKQSSEKKLKAEFSMEGVSEEQKPLTRTGKQLSMANISSEIIRAGDGKISSASPNEPWTVLAHKKPQKGWIAYNPKTMRPPPLPEGTKFVKLVTWNVNGLRALLKLESFSALQLARQENFDILCLQETKLQAKDAEEIKQTLIDGYDHSFWSCSVSRLGYSGTAIISRIKPLSVRYGMGPSGTDHDMEGRIVTAEFDSFYLISAYVPNSGDGLKRLSYRIEEWDRSLSNYMKELEKSKPVILTGDLNCAHEEIDIYNPAGNKRSAGFTIEERKSFDENFLDRGFVDTFRRQHPEVVGYTYWGYRHGGRKTNKGWRLDYFLVSESIADDVHDSYILPDVNGSDHCPIGLILKL